MAGKGLVGRLEVGTPSAGGILNVVPRVHANFHKLRPDVTDGLHKLDKGEQIRLLRALRIAVGFARLVPAVRRRARSINGGARQAGRGDGQRHLP